MACPCCGPKISVLRISRSSVPCRCAAYSRSARFRIDIRPEYAYARVECQPNCGRWSLVVGHWSLVLVADDWRLNPERTGFSLLSSAARAGSHHSDRLPGGNGMFRKARTPED